MFVLHMLFLLDLLAAISCSFQGLSADLPLAVVNLKALEFAVANMKEDTPTELTQLVAAATCEGDVVFRETKLSGVSTAVQKAFKNNWAPILDKMFACVTNHFDDLQTIDAMKCSSLKFYSVVNRHNCFRHLW